MNRRVKDFLESVTVNAKSVFDGLFIWTDKESFVNGAKKLDLIDLVYDETAVNKGGIDYRFMTPKSFTLSTATEEHPGIIKQATEDEILEGTGNGCIKSSQIPLLEQVFTTVNIEVAVSNFTASTTASITASTLKAIIINKLVILTGSVTLTPNTTTALITLVIDNLPKPITGQQNISACQILDRNPRPIAGTIWKLPYSPYSAVILLGTPLGTNFSNTSFMVTIGGMYLSE